MTPPEIDLVPGVDFKQIEGPPRKERAFNVYPTIRVIVAGLIMWFIALPLAHWASGR